MRAAFAPLLLFAVIACDPVHDDAIAALGGETPGVPPGPLHRPGQPCLLCHDGALGDPSALSVAGTLYLEPMGLQPVEGAVVILQGADGSMSLPMTTNAAGNFYWSASLYTPRYPFHVASITQNGVSIAMHSHIGQNGSCSGCHVDPQGPDSPGHIYFDVPPGMTP